MAQFARVGDTVYYPIPGSTGSICTGSSAHIESGRPVARVGDKVCCCPAQGTITSGSSKHFDQGRPLARIGDSVSCSFHGTGVIISGSSAAIDM